MRLPRQPRSESEVASDSGTAVPGPGQPAVAGAVPARPAPALVSESVSGRHELFTVTTPAASAAAPARESNRRQFTGT